MHDVGVERIYGRTPLFSPHLITLQYYSLLRFFIQKFFFVQKLTMTSGSLQLCPEIIDNILIVPEFI